MSRIAAILLFGILVLGPVTSLAEEGAGSLEQVVVKMANTPEEHEALAHYYRTQAAEARAEAKRHKSMGMSYGSGKLREKAAMKRHCQALSDKYTGLADDYDALAKLHDAEAKK